MDNQNKDQKEPLKMIDLNKPMTKDGVGIFFAVCKTAIANTSWARGDFQAVQHVENQLKYLEDYCRQEFREESKPKPEPSQEKKPASENPEPVKPEPKEEVEKPEPKPEESEPKKKIQ